MTDREPPPSNLVDLAAIAPLDVWGEAVRARVVEGERITLAVVELAPGAVVPQHEHPSEQLGMCIEGAIRFTVGDETRELGPGGTWRVLSGQSHGAVAGPDGAIVIDVFSPTRDDWSYDRLSPRPPRWPVDPDGD